MKQKAEFPMPPIASNRPKASPEQIRSFTGQVPPIAFSVTLALDPGIKPSIMTAVAGECRVRPGR
jgi:hypothetical protein